MVISQTAVIENLGGRLIFSEMELIDGKPAMIYFNGSTKSLLFKLAADAEGNIWLDPVVIYQTLSNISSPVLGEINGKPAVAFSDRNLETVFYVQAADSQGSSWNAPVPIDTLPIIGGDTIDLAVVNGVPALSYTAYTQFNVTELRYVRASNADGSSWGTPQTLDNSQPFVGWFSQLEIVDGFPAIAYQDVTLGNLMFIRALDASGSSWGTPQIVDAAGTLGQWLSMTIVDNHPAIAYRYNGTGIVRYVRAAAVDGSSWSAPVDLGPIVQAGGGPVLQVIGGQPALTYFSADNLLYQRATNASGSSWARPTAVYTATALNEKLFYLSLEEVNGRPAIGAQDSRREIVLYERAGDATGSVWGEFERLDGGYSGGHNTLALVNGRPAASFRQNLGGGLRFARALDERGLDWAPGITVDPAIGAGEHSKLLVVNDRPAITYSDDDTGLRYVRAADVDGNSWLSPTILIPNGVYAPYSAIVDGFPAVAYYDDNTGEIRFLRATDQNGTAWGSPVVITSGVTPDSEPGHLALLMLNGIPAVAVADQMDDTLKLFVADNAQGSSWGSGSIVNSIYSSGGFGFDFHAGRLAFAYYEEDTTSFDYYLRYIRASDETATSWLTPTTVITLDDSREPPFVGWLNGRPAAVVAARDTTSNWLLVRASDAAGISWEAPAVLLSENGDGSLLQLDEQALAFADGAQALNYVVYEIENQFDLTVNLNGTGSGRVTSDPSGVVCAPQCTAAFTAGTVVTLTATASADSLFGGWSGACVGTASCVVMLDEARAVEATFFEQAFVYLPLVVRP